MRSYCAEGNSNAIGAGWLRLRCRNAHQAICIARSLLDTFPSYKMAMREVIMSSKISPDEFKVEAVKQVVDRGHSVADVAGRPG